MGWSLRFHLCVESDLLSESIPITIALRPITEGVFAAEQAVVRLGAEEVAFLKRQAVMSTRRRARICAHRDGNDTLHEMLIALRADSYVHPHKHVNKIESFHIIEGLVDVVVLDDSGALLEAIELGDTASGKPFYYRLADSLYHTLVIHSEFLIIHEVTNGPFTTGATILAPFAPPESQRAEALSYLAALGRAVATHRLAQATPGVQ